MSTRFSQWITALVAGLASCHSLAQAVVDEPQRVISFNLGSADTSGTYSSVTTTSAREVDLDYASSPGFAIAWGIEDERGRVLLEYYRSDVEVESAPFAASGGAPELQVQSIFYSGYWVPDIYWGIKGILGAGVGYSEQSLDNARMGEIRDGGLSFKASVGLEYALFKTLSVYLLAESIYLGDVEDRVNLPSSGGTGGGITEITIDGNKQERLALGINWRY